jgi:hypothetical protein
MVTNKRIQLTYRKLINTVLYADDHILMTTFKGELQPMAYHLNFIARK